MSKISLVVTHKTDATENAETRFYCGEHHPPAKITEFVEAATKLLPAWRKIGVIYERNMEMVAMVERREAAFNAAEKAELEKREDAIATWELIEKLRATEGNTVTIICDNPDFNDQPNSAIEVIADFTKWKRIRFTGDTVLLALSSAHEAMLDFKNAFEKNPTI